jgi:hypothetical protein
MAQPTLSIQFHLISEQCIGVRRSGAEQFFGSISTWALSA